MSLLIQGHDGPIVIDEVNQTVTKTYLQPERGVAARIAEREVTYASRFFEALSHTNGLSCPRILAYDLSPPPQIVMGLCRGEPLSVFLKRVRRQDGRIAQIADRIREGIEIYVRFFEEPYYDFCFQNILYDEATAVLTFIDFALPFGVEENRDGAPLEASLGNLVGTACYDLARPANLFTPMSGYLEMAQALLGAFEGRLSRRRVHASAQAAFIRLTRPGTALRRNYYRTAGTLIARLSLHRLGLSPTSPDIVEDPGGRDEGGGSGR